MPTLNNSKNKLIMFMLDYLASTTLSNNECVNIINIINELDNETTLINYVIDILLDTNASSSNVDRIARLLS